MAWNDTPPTKEELTGASSSWMDEPPPAQAESRPGQAALQGFGQMASGGYLPQLQALLARALPNPSAGTDEALKAQGFTIQQPQENYLSERDAFIRHGQELQKQNPKAYLGGELGGILATGALPLGQAAKGASTLAKVARGAATGATLGAIQNPGDTQGEVSPVQLGERAKNAAVGGAVGAAVEPALAFVQALKKGAGTVAKKVASAASGISEKDLETYATKTKEVDQIIKQSGGNITAEADNLRSKLSNELQNKRRQLGNQIGAALESYPKDKAIDSTPILEQIKKWKDRLDPVYDADKFTQLDELSNKIAAKAPDGKLSIQDLNRTKDYLQEQGKSAYMKGGQIFIQAKETAQAAKAGAAEARKILNDLAPEVRDANAKLSKMHLIESRLNKNILAEGKPDAALLAAGSGANPRNAMILKALEQASGVPVSEEAAKLSAAKAFGQESFAPLYSTGKAALGAAAGYGLGGEKGAGLGVVLSNPAILRKVIQAGSYGSRALPNVGQAISNNPERTQMILNRLRALGGS